MLLTKVFRLAASIFMSIVAETPIADLATCRAIRPTAAAPANPKVSIAACEVLARRLEGPKRIAVCTRVLRAEPALAQAVVALVDLEVDAS